MKACLPSHIPPTPPALRFLGRRIWRWHHLAAFLLAGLCATMVDAASATLVVEAVQSPAWHWRQGVRQPLTPGQPLEMHDRILTGNDARVILRLPEGSGIKLGADAELRVADLENNQQKPDRGGVFSAALEVVTGAFRFTTGLFDRVATFSGRDLRIRAATLTAGIRGTDVWGSSTPERNLICLIEGRVSVSHPQAERVQLDVPLSVYRAADDTPPQAPVVVDTETLARWAAETEMPTSGGRTGQGRWQLQLIGQYSESEALAHYDRLRSAGYSARIKPRSLSNEAESAAPSDPASADAAPRPAYTYQVILAGYASQAAAEADAWLLLQNLELAARVVLAGKRSRSPSLPRRQGGAD